LYLVLMQMNFNWSRQMTEMVWLPADYDKCIYTEAYVFNNTHKNEQCQDNKYVTFNN
jgi:hypothetical protein